MANVGLHLLYCYIYYIRLICLYFISVLMMIVFILLFWFNANKYSLYNTFKNIVFINFVRVFPPYGFFRLLSQGDNPYVDNICAITN